MTRQPFSLTLFSRLVWIVLVPSLVYFGLLVVDLLKNPSAVGGVPGGGMLFRFVTGLVLGPGTILTGVLIIRRVRGNVVGPLIILWGVGIAATSSRYDVEAPGVLLTLAANNFYSNAVGLPGLICLLLCFPNGQVYPRRLTRWVLFGVITHFCTVVLWFLSKPTQTIFADLTIPNPVYSPHFAFLSPIISPTFGITLIPLFLAAPISLVMRYRASNRLKRLQIKWLAFAGGFICLSVPVWGLGFALGFIDAWRVLFYLFSPVFPVAAIAIAILRHRLWDIDIIIRRTLIYSVLTAILALLYFGGVVLAQSVLRAVTGQSSDLAIVISTLAIAALFTPLRRRIQNVIDRRLYRRKYDAEQTLAAFSLTMRDEVDLDKMTAELVGVVQETMQPAQISLWVRTPKREHGRS